MTSPIHAHVQAAKRLLAQESASGGNAEQRAASAGRVYEALFESLAPVIGAAGTRVLFARSVKLTQAEFPCLGEMLVPAEAPGSKVQIARQLVGCFSKLEPAAASEVATALYANFFGLMSTFIGDRLVRQIVKSAFPAIDETGPKETS
jgi:hypothetical protein